MNLPTSPHEYDVAQGQYFKRNLKGLISKFFFFQTSLKVKDPSISDKLLIDERRIDI